MSTTTDPLTAAAERLARSQRGRNAMRRVLDWLDDDGLGLDGGNKEAILCLLDAALHAHPMSARDAMRAALGDGE